MEYFKRSWLNRNMECSELGFMESMNRRPTPIKKTTLCSNDHSLKQNGEFGYIVIKHDNHLLRHICVHNYVF